MARNAKLKVFRTPIGFHDAYIAAPSQKAAMQAWGTDKDLFARGEAELVTDPALTAEPLASPGKVIKRLRGTAAEHIASLPDEKPAGRPKKTKAAPKEQSERGPRPSREELEAAERALADAERRHTQQLEELAEREAELARGRRALAKAQSDEMARLERERDKAAAEFEKAMRCWRG
jgi:hypothetical protein